MEQVIQDFRGGLDARKFKLNLPAGTLTDLVNAHITQGGEIEKRKAFVRLVNSSGGVATSLSAGATFGMQETATGIVVFGSGAPTTYPPGVTYQRLTHPDGATAMSGIVHSAVYGDYVFVCVQFADLYQFAYYNGLLVNDFTAGLILPYLNTNPKIAAMLTAIVNNTVNYSALQDASPNDNELDVFSVPGGDYGTTVAIASLCKMTIATADDGGFQSATVTSTDGSNAGDGTKLNLGGKLYAFQLILNLE